MSVRNAVLPRCTPTVMGLPTTWLQASTALLMLIAILANTGHADDQLRKSASWQWPDAQLYAEHLRSYLDQRQVDEPLLAQVEEYWLGSQQAAKGPELLDRLLVAAAMIEPRIEELHSRLQDPALRPTHPRDLDWLTSDVPGWMQDTIRLACGRAFAQRRLYDEALETLGGLDVGQVCDPASLIFYRATCEHHLLKQAECLQNIELLLEREDELPARYAQLAMLMQADIQPLEADSLDEVSRLMNDVQRRLDLGRAGTRVRDEEQQIVDKLDKLIDQIEQQMQQQQPQPSDPSGNPKQGQTQPMEDSQIAGGTGPGDVDKKEMEQRAGWGNLPAAERQEALQRLTQDLPSHYRGLIQGYFRQLAKEE